VKRLSDQTLYEILEIPTGATPDEIGRAYERLHGLYQPGSLVTYTLVTPDEAALLNNRIEEAKAVLLDPDARQRYDERLGIATAPASPEAPLAAPAPAPIPPPAPPPTPPAPPAPAASPWPPPAAVQPPAPLDLPAPAAALADDRPVSPGLPPPPEPVAEPRPEPVEASPAPAPIPLTQPAAALPLTQAVAAPIQLTREVAPPEPPPPDTSHWTGELLRQAREARGVTLQQLAEKTRVTRHHLENIEGERWKALPAPVYLRGILMAMARELRLDGQKVARSFLGRAGGGEPLEPPDRR
jgi:hypothetical protein